MINVILTREDAQEVLHKLGILVNEPDLQEDYKISQRCAEFLYVTIPRTGGVWTVPALFEDVVEGEMRDHILVMRSTASDARNSGLPGQARRITKQAKRLERILGL